MAVLDVSVEYLRRTALDGSSLQVPADDKARVCFCEEGVALVRAGDRPVIHLRAGGVVLLPAGHRLDVRPTNEGSQAGMPTVGNVVITGAFQASFGSCIEVFSVASEPLVETFDPTSELFCHFNMALRELGSGEPGAGAIAAALLKQVLIAVFRECMRSPEQWSSRVMLLRDPQIARAFSEMAARPGLPHTVTSLASVANLSRSAFMARFSLVVGKTPMAVLRDLRMHRAAALLSIEPTMLEYVSQAVGYGSRSGFVRAFRQAFGRDPGAVEDAG